jgi:two-component system chemotaxis sensor kinase CheA
MTSQRLSFDLGAEDARIFLDECREEIDRIESGLLELERDPSAAAVVNDVFRAAHTLKGSAATIGHRRMAELTHAMEDVFGALRSGRLDDLAPLAEPLLATIDVLRALVEEVTAGEALTDAPEALTAELRRRLELALGATDQGGGARDAAARTSPAAGAQAREAEADRPPSAAQTRIRCSVDPASEWRSVRLLQAVLAAAESGHLVASEPSQAEIEAGTTSSSVELQLAPPPDALSDLVDRLRAIDEVVAVEVVAVPERRVIDLGPEGRGISADQRLALAGDRLRSASQTIRIDVARLDELLNLVGEIVVHKTRLQRQAAQLALRLGDDPLAREAEEGAQHFARVAGQLQDQVTALRMLPIETVFSRFPRVVRDLAAKLGKQVELVIDGRETELDRSVLEEVGDPLGHLVRNAIDHGIEPPDLRVAAGKPPVGRVRLSARHADGSIVIAVEDDGRGIDPEALRRAAVERGILTPEAAAGLSDAEARLLIFAPGFSTAGRVTDVSGRGVGMDVVRTNIERLGGRVEVESTPGVGTRISLTLPLTLAIVEAMVVRAGEATYALPVTGVVETLRTPSDAVAWIGGRSVLLVRGQVVALDSLEAALGRPGGAGIGSRAELDVVVVRSGDRQLALVVDGFVGNQEIVLKSLGSFVGRPAGIAGATIMADGSVALVVDIPALVARTREAARRVA